MTRTRLITIALVAGLVLATVPSGAMAQSDDEGVLTGATDAVSSAWESAKGTAARFFDSIADVFSASSEDETPQAVATDLQEYAQDHEGQLLDYANSQWPEDQNKSIESVQLVLQGEDPRVVVLDARVENDSFTDLAVTVRQNRTDLADLTVVVEESAVDDLPDEAAYAYENYVLKDKDPAPLRTRWVSRFGGSVNISSGGS